MSNRDSGMYLATDKLILKISYIYEFEYAVCNDNFE